VSGENMKIQLENFLGGQRNLLNEKDTTTFIDVFGDFVV
jgi:hypothetical protein